MRVTQMSDGEASGAGILDTLCLSVRKKIPEQSTLSSTVRSVMSSSRIPDVQYHSTLQKCFFFFFFFLRRGSFKISSKPELVRQRKRLFLEKTWPKYHQCVTQRILPTGAQRRGKLQREKWKENCAVCKMLLGMLILAAPVTIKMTFSPTGAAKFNMRSGISGG